MNILRVALDLPLPRLFDYLAPDSDESDIGRRVNVPFGTGSRTGVIIELVASSEYPDTKLKTVGEILRDMPALPKEWLALCEFCARYYQAPLGEVTSFALPMARTWPCSSQTAFWHSATMSLTECDTNRNVPCLRKPRM